MTGGFAQGDPVGPVAVAGGLERQVRQDVRGHGRVPGVVGGPQAGEEVPLGEAVLVRVECHPAGELPEIGERGQQPPGRCRRIRTLVHHQGDRAQLRADVTEAGSTAFGVVELLQQRDARLDLLDQKIAPAGDWRNARRWQLSSQVCRDRTGERGSGHGEKLPAIHQASHDPVLGDYAGTGNRPRMGHPRAGQLQLWRIGCLIAPDIGDGHPPAKPVRERVRDQRRQRRARDAAMITPEIRRGRRHRSRPEGGVDFPCQCPRCPASLGQQSSKTLVGLTAGHPGPQSHRSLPMLRQLGGHRRAGPGPHGLAWRGGSRAWRLCRVRVAGTCLSDPGR